jgi:hypothetical protein
MYLPRTTFADFLLYVPRQTDDVFIIPRGLLSYDTGWALVSLQPYLHAWKLLKETSPQLFKRKFLPISPQLQRVIDLAKDLELDFELIHTKKGAKRAQFRLFSQRQIIIHGKRCTIYTASQPRGG